MKPILNKQMILDWIEEKGNEGAGRNTPTLSDIDNALGRTQLLRELLVFINDTI